MLHYSWRGSNVLCLLSSASQRPSWECAFHASQFRTGTHSTGIPLRISCHYPYSSPRWLLRITCAWSTLGKFNVSLQHIHFIDNYFLRVAFYYIGRSLTTVFNVLLSYTLLRQKTSFQCIVCCGVVVFGFLLGVDQESLSDSFSWFGTFFGILGSLSLSLYSIYTKKSLSHVNNDIWLISYYNNVYSSFLFLPLIVISGEIEEVMKYEHLREAWFWMAMTIGGICGFSIGYVTSLQIKVTSPLTHNISGTAKACAQTVLAVQWFNETKSFLWWTSNVVILMGSGIYARIKQLEIKQLHKESVFSQKI